MQRISFLQVFAFVWRYWRHFPVRFSVIVSGVLLAVWLEIQVPARDPNRECKGQGLANMVAGVFGGMAGCAMIGQSVINVKSGGRGRLSTFIAGIFLLIMVVFLSGWISQIPMAALVAVMIMVSIGTFNWNSIFKARSYPLSSNIVIFATVAIVLWTHNLAYGVFIGVLLSSLFFANKISHYFHVEKEFI